MVRADGPNSGCGFKIYIDSVKASVDSELDSVCRGGDYSGYYSYGSTLVVPVKINEYVRTNKLVNATIQNIEWMPFGTGDLVKQ